MGVPILKSVSKVTKHELHSIYESLNPAELKRQINKKRNELYLACKRKSIAAHAAEVHQAQKAISVTFLRDATEAVSVT